MNRQKQTGIELMIAQTKPLTLLFRLTHAIFSAAIVGTEKIVGSASMYAAQIYELVNRAVD